MAGCETWGDFFTSEVIVLVASYDARSVQRFHRDEICSVSAINPFPRVLWITYALTKVQSVAGSLQCRLPRGYCATLPS